tara:strand:+ start:1347 stop:2486 length:1140 start_codon:yes stop_codon:yes gene_type:complete
MKKIIYTKISSDCLKFFLLTIFSIATIIWVLQAVNFLDFIVEDGHGFFVYLNYTLLSFPKIFSKIFLFTLFFSVTYVLLKYEDKNELVIFWNIGIHKIKFVNFFIRLSILFVIINLILNAIVVPKTQDSARSFIRASDLDLFEGIIRPKKFITAAKDLTVLVDNKNENGELRNIFIKENSSENDFQIIFAKTGKFEKRGDRKILVLNQGKTINSKNNNLSLFGFEKSDFNISKFGTTTITHQKIQETSTIQLFKCLLILKSSIPEAEALEKKLLINNCDTGNLEPILKEIYKRLILPFYSIFLILISLLLILKSKNDQSFRFYKIKIFIFGFLTIIFSEISLKFIVDDVYKNLPFLFLPFLLIFLIYIYFLTTLKNKSR